MIEEKLKDFMEYLSKEGLLSGGPSHAEVVSKYLNKTKASTNSRNMDGYAGFTTATEKTNTTGKRIQ